jgi:hypothetical protein
MWMQSKTIFRFIPVRTQDFASPQDGTKTESMLDFASLQDGTKTESSLGVASPKDGTKTEVCWMVRPHRIAQ